MTLAPIVLFVYNRPKHTKLTLEALAENDLASESVLYIFADGAKKNASVQELENMTETRLVIRAKTWCKEVYFIESDINKGLANSIIEGVTKIVNEYGRIIVLEDDLLTGTGFLKYMNNALNKYEKCNGVMQISGYFFPIKKIKKRSSSFFLKMATSWGWATWKTAWAKFDPSASGYQKLKGNTLLARQFDLDSSYPYTNMLLQQMEAGSIDSWAIRWWWTVFKENGLTLFPDYSLVENFGYDQQGTHTRGANPYLFESFDNRYTITYFPASVKNSKTNFKKVTRYLQRTNNTKKKFPILLTAIIKFKSFLSRRN